MNNFPKIHQFATQDNSIFSNAYIVEGEKEIVVIDSTLAVSTSKALRKKVDDLGKPLVAVLLTHGHPDHYNGLTELVKDLDVPVYAAQGVHEVIKKYDTAKEQLWRPVFKDEWPTKRLFPTKIAVDGQTLSFDGMDFTLHDIGPGESHHDTYWTLSTPGQKIVFIGDIVLHGMHAYVTDGHTTAWLATIEKLKTELKDMAMVYPGHGESGDLSLLDWQKEYLEKYRATVGKFMKGSAALSDEDKKAIEAEMLEAYPQNKLSFLITLGADSVKKELE